jgi:IPT/TIG domain/FG-GAP-like repeat/ASPIC and UnbV
MRFQTALIPVMLAIAGRSAFGYAPGKSPSGANRHWAPGTISVQLTEPVIVDGHTVHDGVRNAMASWNAIANARIRLQATGGIQSAEPTIGNGKNEFGWVEGSDSPYFIPGVPCTTAYIYDTLTGAMQEADTTCNAMAYQWPDDSFGLYTQDAVADSETAALAAFGSWLGLDASLEFGDPMYPAAGPGHVLRNLTSDEFAFGRYQYGDGSSTHGSISGTVRFADGRPIPYGYVEALGFDGYGNYGAVADALGVYQIVEPMAGNYTVLARPLTTDPYVLSSVAYRANAIANLDFTPEFHADGALVQVQDGASSSSIDITVSRSGTQPDTREPNDSAQTASPLTVGTSILATTHAALDDDWYWFQTQPGLCYVVATWFHGASIVSTLTSDVFWSRTRLSIYAGGTLLASNDSRDGYQLDPGNWITFCESGSSRRIDIQVAQRSAVGGAGFFYIVSAQAVPGAASLAPEIGALYPNSGWTNRNRFVWIDGANFMPGAKADIRLPGGSWIPASQAIASGCDSNYRCSAVKALLPAAPPGTADVRVTNPNGLTAMKLAAFSYLQSDQGPISDQTPRAFGVRYGDGRAVCIGDYDGDGADDIFKSRYASLPYQLFHNNADGTFSDVAAAAGLHLYPAPYGQSCSFIDVDDDGDLDLYATNLSAAPSGGTIDELYINQLAETGSAKFVLNTPAGLGGDAGRYQTDAAWADFDKDGRLDVVLSYDAYAESAPYRDAVRLLRQGVDGAFTDVTYASGLSGYIAAITSVKAADFNGDGCVDLVFFTLAGAANRLYKGDCRGHFTDATAQAHIADGAPWCTGIAIADFNNDGKPDIFCGTYNAGPGGVRPRLWLNDGTASFTDRASEAGLYAVARNMDVVLALDEDNDGLIDVYLGASENGWLDDRKDVLLRNIGGSPPVFQDITDAAGMRPTTADGTGVCGPGVDEFYCDRDAAAGGVFDWFGDGAQDVFVTGSDPDGLQRGADFLWRNGHNAFGDGSIGLPNDWIELALKGANTRASRVLSNRSGIGARVTVIPRFNLPGGALPTETQCLQDPLPTGVTGIVQDVIAGNQSQSSTVLHVGLGSVLPFGSKRVDCVRVRWPSGLERAYIGVTANSKSVLAEDAGRMKIIAVVPNAGSNAQSNPTAITGLHFDRDVIAVPKVYFGAVPALSVAFVSDHELTVRPPLWQPPGAVDVTVVNTDGARDTLLAGYTYTGPTTSLRFKDPVPSMLITNATVPNDPNFVAARGIDRTGVIADGVTELVFEAEVAGPGTVRLALDDDDDPANAPAAGTSVGTATPLGGGPPLTTLLVPVVQLTDGRFVGHAVYTAPQNFIRDDSDSSLRMRSIRVRGTFVDGAGIGHAMPERSLDLYRVPVLFVHGMWADATAFSWPVLDDPRWIVHRADYRATNDATFAENSGMPPRAVAELRKKLNDLGIAGTRVFVFGHSMGGVLFKAYMGGTAAPYARVDNFFAGDVYALVPVDSPFFGSSLAPFTRFIASLEFVGPLFAASMGAAGMNVNRGCLLSLDPAGRDILGMPSAEGTFHAMVGWGGREMRNAGVQIANASRIQTLQTIFGFFNATFESALLSCDTGDDVVVCVNSQEGGITGGHVDDFHFAGATAKAIHFDSICAEADPSATAERLLNTPTTDFTVWAQELPQAPTPAPGADPHGAPAKVAAIERPAVSPFDDGLVLSVGKQAGDVLASWSGAAARLWKSRVPSLAPGICLAVSGGSVVDAGEATVPADAYYRLGANGECTPGQTLSVASVSPALGSARGGYAITILGTGFAGGASVRIGPFYAADVVVVNDTTITCRILPGDPGPTLVTVVDASGQSASTTFTYVDPGPVDGGVLITAPLDGAAVLAGSTLTVSAIGTGGFTIDKALAASPAFVSADDFDPGAGFTARVTVPSDVVGPITINLVARDVSGHLAIATPVTAIAVVPGDVTLRRLYADKVTMLYASPTAQIHVYGVYADGVLRDITRVPGLIFEMDTQDPRKPNYPYNGTGVATVDATGLVTAKTQGSTLCHVTYSGQTVDVVIEVAEIRPTVTILKPGFISWPYQGPGITYDVMRGKLSVLRASRGNFSDPSIGTACIKNDFTNVTAADASNPPVGDGFFYLMRESRTRSYDESPFWATRSQFDLRTAKIDGSPNACP